MALRAVKRLLPPNKFSLCRQLNTATTVTGDLFLTAQSTHSGLEQDVSFTVSSVELFLTSVWRFYLLLVTWALFYVCIREEFRGNYSLCTLMCVHFSWCWVTSQSEATFFHLFSYLISCILCYPSTNNLQMHIYWRHKDRQKIRETYNEIGLCW